MPLPIIQVEEGRSTSAALPNHSIQLQARLEKMWREQPDLFLSGVTVEDRLRIKRIQDLIQRKFKLEGATALDIACGDGWLTHWLSSQGAQVTAIDGSSLALQTIQADRVSPVRALFPELPLPDGEFTLICCLELLASLPSHQLRLALSEIRRLMAPNGKAFLSTPLSTKTSGALERFETLLQLEFEIEGWLLSSHRLAHSVRSALRGPLVSLRNPFLQSKGVWLVLESVSEKIWKTRGATHAIAWVRPRAIHEPTVQAE